MIYFGLLLLIGVELIYPFITPYSQETLISFIDSGQHDKVLQFIVYVSLFMLVTIVMTAINQPLKNWLATSIYESLTLHILNKVHRIPLKRYQTYHTGDLFQRISYDTRGTIQLFEHGFEQLFYNILFCIGAFIYLFHIHPIVAILLLCASPLLSFTPYLFQKSIGTLSSSIAEHQATIRALQQEALQNTAVIQAFAANEWFLNKFVAERKKVDQLVFRQTVLTQVNGIINHIGLNIIGIASLIILGLAAIEGTVQPGSIVAFFALINFIHSPFINISNIVMTINQSIGYSVRLFEIVDEIEEPRTSNTMSVKMDDVYESLQFSELYYSYKESPNDNNDFLLKHINWTVPKQSMISLVGPSGSGKSTMAKLAAGLLLPDLGDVSLGRISVLNHLDDYRAQVAYVPQTPFLFHGSIRNNLTMFNEYASDEDLIKVTKICQAHDFIEQLPDGYDTVVSERGESLSGGQRQRIMIARAILLNRPIIILDEATSALDVQTELELIRALKTSLHNRTIIFITHRLTATASFDRIDYMEAGSIVESGTHAELIEDNKLYATLYENH